MSEMICVSDLPESPTEQVPLGWRFETESLVRADDTFVDVGRLRTFMSAMYLGGLILHEQPGDHSRLAGAHLTFSHVLGSGNLLDGLSTLEQMLPLNLFAVNGQFYHENPVASITVDRTEFDRRLIRATATKMRSRDYTVSWAELVEKVIVQGAVMAGSELDPRPKRKITEELTILKVFTSPRLLQVNQPAS